MSTRHGRAWPDVRRARLEAAALDKSAQARNAMLSFDFNQSSR